VPVGETLIRIFSFVGDVRVSVPEGVGVSVSSMAFVTDVRGLGQKGDYIMTPFELSSDDYENAERRVRLETLAFVRNLRVRRVQAEEPVADFWGQEESPGETPMD